MDMKGVLELIGKGVFTTRIVTLALTGICCYLWLNGIQLDETLKTSWLIIIGFWFNSELSGQVITKFLEKSKE